MRALAILGADRPERLRGSGVNSFTHQADSSPLCADRAIPASRKASRPLPGRLPQR